MKPQELIAHVAVEYLRQQLDQEPSGTLRFCIIGFDRALTSAIAATVAGHPDLAAIEVQIPRSLATATLDPSLQTDEAAVHWRNSLPRTPGKRALLFAIDSNELQRSEGSIASLTRLDTVTLRSLFDEWLAASGLQTSLSDDEQSLLRDILSAVEQSRLARTIDMYADFIARIAVAIKEGTCTSVQDAADYALPALKLPRRAEVFTPVVRRNGDAQALERQLRQFADETRSFLAKQTSRGDPLDLDKLQENLAGLKERGDISAEESSAIEQFISDSSITPDTWQPSQATLVDLDWKLIAPVFEGIERKSKTTLGEETLAFFEAEYPNVLDEDDCKMLKRLKAGSKATTAMVDFFHAHRSEIAHSRQTRTYKNLAAKWERLVFRDPVAVHDLLEGMIATMHRLIERAEELPAQPCFVVELPGSKQKSFWNEQHNTRLSRYFQQRYHGIDRLFGDTVKFSLGRMQTHPLEELEEISTSRSKSAIEFKFEMLLLDRGQLGSPQARQQAPTAQFIWTLPAEALALSLPGDLRAITHTGYARLLTSRVTREPLSAKGDIQQVRLAVSSTLRDARGGSDGYLISIANGDDDLYPPLCSTISQFYHDGLLSAPQKDELLDALGIFCADYSRALSAWTDPTGEGIAAAAFLEHAKSYGRLLEILQQVAHRDRCRHELWRPLLSIGTVAVETGGRAAIIAPWHPLRLAEIAIKAQQTAGIVRRLCEASLDDLEGADLFFEQMQCNLRAPYYPEVCLDFSREQPGVLALTAHLADYSLMEPPTLDKYGSPDEEGEALDAEAAVAAERFARLSEQYLELQPHQRANFSAVLYNADSKDLPSALADELASRVERETDLRCDLLLSHDDPVRIRRIYEQQNAAAGDDAETTLASEAARNFLSRLRVSFIDIDTLPRQQGPAPADLVFLQDVVARGAEPDWLPSPFADMTVELKDHVPTQWSRRRPIARGDETVAVYLAAPLQPREGQVYLDALQIMVTGRSPESRHWLPVRKVAFQNNRLHSVLERAHEIGDWVVSYDALADRRLFREQNISIIRYINDRTSQRGLIVSTTREPRFLLSILQKRLTTLLPTLSPTESSALAHRFVRRALELSGQIVMRAARYGNCASELLGVVLCMARVREQLGATDGRHIGWFFLDDYASWFNQREGQIADILAVNPAVENGQPVLKLLIAESKFVAAAGYRTYAKKSASQLIETTTRIARAIDPQRNRIDRQVWLERLADLMLEAMEPFDDAPINGWNLNHWSREIRRGNVAIRLLGLSTVFVHEADSAVTAGAEPIDGWPCLQEIFDQAGTRRLIEAFAEQKPADGDEEITTERWKVAQEWRPAQDAERVTATAITAGASARTAVAEPDPEPEPELALTAVSAPQPTTVLPSAVNPVTPPASGVVPATSPSAAVSEGTPSANNRRYPERLAYWLAKTAAELDQDIDLIWLEDTVRRLQGALRSYAMTSEVINSRLTPNAALIRLRGSDSLTIRNIERRQQELMTSHALNVINVLPGLGQVIIMVQRPNRQVLRLRKLWCERQLPDTAPTLNTSLLLGAKEEDGNLLYLNIGGDFAGHPQHGPHTLIAGETGSGKGILVQNLLLDICATNAPHAAKIRMIDPKAGVDFPWLRRMPHLDGDLLTTQEDAIAMLEETVAEMGRRYHLFAETKVSKLAQYNRLVSPDERLPVIWLFHDEVADWMLMDAYRDAVETNVTRLGVKARAAGIHLVLVTQRPDKDALPMQLRANMSNRLVLKVADRRNSELVLDEPGAEKLLGRGHLAAKLSGEGQIILTQVPFADEDEIFDLADTIATAWL